MKTPFNVRNVVAAMVVAGLLLLPLYTSLSGKRVRADLVHPHRDLPRWPPAASI